MRLSANQLLTLTAMLIFWCYGTFAGSGKLALTVPTLSEDGPAATTKLEWPTSCGNQPISLKTGDIISVDPPLKLKNGKASKQSPKAAKSYEFNDGIAKPFVRTKAASEKGPKELTVKEMQARLSQGYKAKETIGWIRPKEKQGRFVKKGTASVFENAECTKAARGAYANLYEVGYDADAYDDDEVYETAFDDAYDSEYDAILQEMYLRGFMQGLKKRRRGRQARW
mmetsp:Transcript_47003/g.78024  ORF Transcript_47003/g.78024 Transcript_47003/m.78024 type:complete len:226 (+) Transcript_47003:51-728(+)|eukprot:CAMPEP_0202722984 /NCGR_PEP_ID=MMETSP1385-20130828/161984_1 /ASSEMBLY_ACC=CAM_ASM_000861 /TAXON_ID=933848 /ORGANISM="Elphidium margaritaceum" /LENGTH=225 /DNA_ID=CAMNT_0049387903 /DNA_START=35 /DNA_END=712 /DNA_ORIENTATION=+